MIPRKVKWYEKRDDSPEQAMQRVWDVEDCKKLQALRSFYLSNDMRARELEELWVKKPENRATASYGTNWGFYVGMGEIERYYVKKHQDDRERQLAAYKQADPGFSGVPGHGVSCMRVTNTPQIFEAGDGKTAQGLWYMVAEDTVGRPGNEAEGWWFYGRVAADFMLEDGVWKLWHVMDCYDLTCPVGVGLEEFPAFPSAEQEYIRREFERGEPTIKFLAHEYAYHASDCWPRLPGAHETYNPENSCGPDGHPALMEDNCEIDWMSQVASMKAWGR